MRRASSHARHVTFQMAEWPRPDDSSTRSSGGYTGSGPRRLRQHDDGKASHSGSSGNSSEKLCLVREDEAL